MDKSGDVRPLVRHVCVTNSRSDHHKKSTNRVKAARVTGLSASPRIRGVDKRIFNPRDWGAEKGLEGDTHTQSICTPLDLLHRETYLGTE